MEAESIVPEWGDRPSRAKSWRKILMSLAVLLAAAAVLTPTNSYAQSLTHHDLRGDVYADNPGPQNPRVPRQTDGDIRTVHLTLTKRYFVASATFRSLSAAATSHAFLFDVTTDSHAHRGIALTNYRHRNEVYVNGGADTGPCASRSQVDLRQARIHLVVPIQCLGDPRWIKIMFRTQDFYDDQRPEQAYLDSGFNLHGNKGLAYSRPLHRG